MMQGALPYIYTIQKVEARKVELRNSALELPVLLKAGAPDQVTVTQFFDTGEIAEEEKVSQAHQRRKIHGADWAEKLKLTSDIAQVNKEETIIQPITTSDSTHVVDFLNPIQANLSNPDSKDIVSDKPELTFEEKNKLLWGSKKPAPRRDSSEILKKI
ncbi:hypothetical protein AgCh_001097 [Apium graveolens]